MTLLIDNPLDVLLGIRSPQNVWFPTVNGVIETLPPTYGIVKGSLLIFNWKPILYTISMYLMLLSLSEINMFDVGVFHFLLL